MRAYTALASLAALTLTGFVSAQAIRQPLETGSSDIPRAQDAIKNLFLGRPKQMAFKDQNDPASDPKAEADIRCEDINDKNPSNPARWFTSPDGKACLLTEVRPVEDTIEGKSLVDVLTVERKGSLWWEYARDVVKVVRVLAFN